MSISLVQSNQSNSPNSTSTSLAVTLGSGITQGNLVVAAVACGNNATTITGPSGWTQSVINQPAGANALIEASLWYMVVPSGHAGETSWTWNFSAAHSLFICIEEWSSTTGWMASPVDQAVQGDTAGSPTQSTTPSSGTTGTTLEAVELWVGSIAYKGSAQSESSITSGWTKDKESTLASANTMTMLYQIASSTGTAGCQYTIGSAQYWAGVVTTFKPSLSRTIPATAALQSLGLARTIPATAALQSLGLSRTIPATAALVHTSSRTISPVTASLINTLSRTVPASAALQSLGIGRTIPASAALTVTKSRTILASAALAVSAVFYASNVAQTQGGLTQSDQMSEVAGGTETSYTVTMPASGTNSYVELLSQGGTATGTSSLPSPTGKGWSINLAGNTILAGSWSFAFTLKKSGTTMTGASLYVRAYRRTMDGTYYPISSSVLTGQSYSTTKTVYTLPSDSATLWQFISGDTLYMDAFVLNPTTAWSSDVFTVYVSNSASLGVYNDGIIISPQLVATPAELACYIGIPSLQTGTTLPIRDQSITIADAIDQRSIATLTGEDTAGTLSYQRAMPTYIGDHDQGLLYTGYINSDKVSKPAAGTSNAQLEHALTMMDNHYLVDKRANQTNYLNWSAGDMVCDFIQSTLSQEGVTGAFALESDYTPTTFGQGTLSGTVATTTTSPFSYAPNTATPPVTSNTGDLELTRAGTQFTLTETTTSDFSTGTLTNMTASSNSLSPDTVKALRFTANLPVSGAGNTIGAPASNGPTGTGGTAEIVTCSIYAQIWSGSVTVGSNDTFNYDVFISSTSPAYMAGVDVLFSDGTYLSSYNGSLGAHASTWDQNNLTPDVLTDLTNYARNGWYTRNVSLNTLVSAPVGINLAGKTITGVYLFIAGGTAGQYTMYAKNIYLGSASGSPFFSTSATVTQVNPPTVVTNGGYIVNTGLVSVVNAWIATASSRVSGAHSISGVGLVQNSTISWTASLPTTGAASTPYPPGFAATSSSGSAVAPSALIFVSYDATTWLPCTNSAPLPGLPAGANVAGVSLYLLDQFQLGSDPTAIPSLLQVTITINSAANQTTSDITAAYGTTASWNTGTATDVGPNSNGDLALLSSLTYSWTTSSGVTTFPSHVSTSVSSGTITFTSTAAQGSGTARFDFAGSTQNFTANFQMKLSSPSSANPEVFFFYRAGSFTTTGVNSGYALRMYINNGGSGNATVDVSANGNTLSQASVLATLSLGTTYNFKVVVSGNTHVVYINNTEFLSFYDNTVTTPGDFGFGFQGSGNTGDSGVFSNFSFTGNVSEGTWLSPSINLNSLGTCGYTQIAWSELSTAGASQSTTIVLASTNGGSTWAPCSNGAEIPGLTPGTSVTGTSLQIQMILSATTYITSPIITGLFVRVCGNYGTVTGTRISPALNLSNVGYVSSSNCMWNANIPTSTSLTVQTTQDLSSFHTVGSNGAGEALPYWTNQPAATQDLFNTNTSANYSNTSKSGGSAASATYDTTNSRITLTGGSGGLYLNTSAGSMTDMDMLIDMDESDAGGMVWREVSTSNYYELGVYDASSSGGFTNQLRLYKVSSGTRSLLGSASAITFTRSTFHRIRVTMQSGLINVYWDGNCVQSYLDTSPLGSGACGLRNDGGTSRYYQLWAQPLGTNLTGQSLYTKVTMTTTDPSVMPQLFTLVCAVRGPSIATGATISQLHPVTTPFATYYSNEMDTLVQASGDYFWYVDKWQQMHFGPRLARPGAFPIQSVADSAGVYSGYLLYQPQVQVTSSADLFRSQQIVTNVTGTVTPPVEVKTSDGSTTSWTMGYPLYSAPVVTINGNSATVGVQGIDNNRQFYWQPHSASISYDSSLPKLPTGTVLTFTYVGESTVNVVINNSASQTAQAALEGNSGIVAEIESALRTATNGMTTTQATTFGTGLLSRYGNNATIEIIGSTRYIGLAPGTVIPLFLPEMMSTWNAQLPIVKLTTNVYQGASGLIWIYTVDATNGPGLNNWARVFFT